MQSFRPTLLCVAATLGACAPSVPATGDAVATPAPHGTLVRDTSRSALAAIPPDDRTRIAEAFRLADAIGDGIWPGWSSVPFALLLVTPDQEYLVRHSRPPADFVRTGYDSLLQSEVLARPRTFSTKLLAIPGTRVMRARRNTIAYRVVDRPRGAEVRITTTDSTALAAVRSSSPSSAWIIAPQGTKAIRSGRMGRAHEVSNNRLVLSGTTEELRAALGPYVMRPGVFTTPTVWQRVRSSGS